MNNGGGAPSTGTTVTGSPIAENNHIDSSGAFGAFYPVLSEPDSTFYPGSFQAYSNGLTSDPTWTFLNQWNMVTGVAISNTPP
jgi:hypothetical protein